mgnify:FL=1
MKVIVAREPEAVAHKAAKRILACVRSTPHPSIGLATGGTQSGIYRLLIDAYQRGEVSFAHTIFFMLDEYTGVVPDRPHSFQHTLRTRFLCHVDAPADALRVLDGNAPDLSVEAERFEQALADQGGIDLQLLGIGTNGHIGFNEPGSPFDSRTREVELHEDTRISNATYFSSISEVPRHAISQGIGTIMEAREILLMAKGLHKAPAVQAMIDGDVDSDHPASILQRHPDTTVIVDAAAASLLSTKV